MVSADALNIFKNLWCIKKASTNVAWLFIMEDFQSCDGHGGLPLAVLLNGLHRRRAQLLLGMAADAVL